MERSGFFQNGLELSYEISIDGYEIFWGNEGRPRLLQREPNIPYPWLGYEENAKIQIQQLCGLNPEIPGPEDAEPWVRIEKILTEDVKTTAEMAEKMGRAGAATGRYTAAR